jgi:ribosome-binding factor A
MSQRTGKVEEIIKQAAATFVLHEANPDPMITITRVDISPDLKRAFVFFTTVPEAKQSDAHIFLKRTAGDFRHFLKQNVSLKRIPHVEFMIDAGERHRQHIDDMFRDIETENQDK